MDCIWEFQQRIKQGNGFSLPEQKERLETFCKFKGYEIVDYYQDAGISAKTGNYRPEFERLKAEIDTAFDYIPDESNDSVIYTKEPIAISVGVKPVKFCEEKAKELLQLYKNNLLCCNNKLTRTNSYLWLANINFVAS